MRWPWAADDFFGVSVSVSGDVILVGAYQFNDHGSNSGSAYVFRWNGTAWVQESKLLAGDGTTADTFGNSVSLSGDVALVGALTDSENGASSGSAYVFRWNGSAWVQEQKLLSDDGAAHDRFGISVSVSGDAILVGAAADEFGFPPESAYVFRWNGNAWIQEQKLLASDGASGDFFGFSVSVSGDVALVGAGFDDDNGFGSGSAYLFRWNGTAWIQESKLLAGDGTTGDGFGSSVSLSGDVALVGAPRDDDSGTDSGSSRVFSIGVTDCNQNDVFDACDIGSGTSGDCNNNGIPDDCEVPQSGAVVSTWVGTEGPWRGATLAPLDNANWCLPESPDNNADATFDVLIDSPTAVVVLNTSPTVRTLSLSSDAVVLVDDQSGANVRTLSVDETIINDGIFRATDRERLVLDAAVIDQGGFCGAGGTLEAVDGFLGAGEEADTSILEINGARVLGGIARTIGDNSEIHLIGGAELVDVCIDGVVVPDGQTGQFSGTVVNDDVLTVRGNALDTRLSPTRLNAVLSSSSGTGCVRLTSQAHAQLGGFKTAFTNASGHTIDGAGIIFGGLTNQGTVDANGNEDLIIFPSIQPKLNSGFLRATGNGTLRIEGEVMQSPSGRIEATDGGSVAINADIEGTGGMLAQGGTITITDIQAFLGRCIDVPPPRDGFESQVRVIGSTITATDPSAPNDLTITGGTVSLSENSNAAFAGPVTVCPASSAEAVLEITDSTFSAGELEVCECGVVKTTNGLLSVAGSLAFANTNEADWSWIASAALEMTGGRGLSDDGPSFYASLEVGGGDLGTNASNHIGDPKGFAGNFALSELIIGPDAHVSLVDFLDNGNRIDHGFGSDEALYTNKLTFADASGRLNLNSLHLYYETLVGDPTQVIDLPRKLGDFDADCDVDLKDTAALQNCLKKGAPDHACRVFDSNGDGSLQPGDVASYITVLGGPGCP